ncbi:MAG: metallophosphoesterase [Deltaproteobacteria bacterium]|jgi:predicted MPP superfamily phosphohydrolase|nr:metallophosphoesterase [Deltaproteobacteria bacterium]
MAVTPIDAILVLLMILAQSLAWRYFLARLESKFLRVLVNFLYIIANILGLYAVITVYLLDFNPPTSFLWNYVVRPGLIWEFVHLVWLVPALIIKIFCHLVRREPKGLTGLFRAEKKGPRLLDPIGIVLIIMLLFAFYGYGYQLAPPQVTRLSLNYEDLPKDLNGFTIALVSDFHYGRGQNFDDLNRSMAELAELKPDIVFFLGNMVDDKSLLTNDFRGPMGALKNVPHGIYAVLGNYDHYTENPHNVTQLLTTAGARVLANERVILDELPLSIIGFNDPGTKVFSLWPLSFPSQDIALPWSSLPGGLPPEGHFTILLNHRPVGIETAYLKGDVDLFLAGHTRGGIMQLPGYRGVNLASFFYDYSSGQYQVEGMEVFVTRGLAAPVSPFRLFAWPEIALITLTGPQSPADPPKPSNNGDTNPSVPLGESPSTSPQGGDNSSAQNVEANGF